MLYCCSSPLSPPPSPRADGPKFKQISISEDAVMNGSTVMLHCIMIGHPPPAIIWYHNGTVVEEERTVLFDNGTLVIVSALLSDAGMYHCVGNSNNGVTTSPEEVMLRVHSECNLWDTESK